MPPKAKRSMLEESLGPRTAQWIKFLKFTDLPEYIRNLRRKALDEPTTEAEAAQRQLLKQDPQLHKNFMR